MTTSLVRAQSQTPASGRAAPGVPTVDEVLTTPIALVVPATIRSAPRRPPLHLVLAGLRRRARAESAASDAIVALVAEQAESRYDAHFRNDEGGADDDGGWG